MRAIFLAFRVGYTQKFINYGPLIWPPACNELMIVGSIGRTDDVYTCMQFVCSMDHEPAYRKHPGLSGVHAHSL